MGAGWRVARFGVNDRRLYDAGADGSCRPRSVPTPREVAREIVASSHALGLMRMARYRWWRPEMKHRDPRRAPAREVVDRLAAEAREDGRAFLAV